MRLFRSPWIFILLLFLGLVVLFLSIWDIVFEKEWMGLIYGNIEREVDADIIAYNQEEFQERLPSSSFLRHALSSGRVVYEKAI